MVGVNAVKPNKAAGIACLVMVAALAAGCQSGAKPAGPPIANGTWASTDGVYTANFSNGVFTATANDTGETLSRGNYVVKSDSQIRINWVGNVSRTNNSAECIKPGTEQMDCVDQNGRKFSLKRQG